MSLINSLITRFLCIAILVTTASAMHQQASRASSKVITVMIDPAGDAQHAGRPIDDSFERGLTLQCAEEIKRYLETQYDDIRVILTRFPGETLQPLQNANFANRLNVDLYVSIHFYQELLPKSQLFLFTYATDTTPALNAATRTSFLPCCMAHKISAATTQQYASIMHQTVARNEQFITHAPLQAPFKPLIGICSPAIALEAGLKQKNSWQDYTQPFAVAIAAACHR